MNEVGVESWNLSVSLLGFPSVISIWRSCLLWWRHDYSDSRVTIFSIIVSVLFPAKIAFYPTFNSNSQWIWMSCIRHLDIPTTIITSSLPGVHVLLLLLPITGLHNSTSPLPDYNNCVRFISVVHQGFIINLEVFCMKFFWNFNSCVICLWYDLIRFVTYSIQNNGIQPVVSRADWFIQSIHYPIRAVLSQRCRILLSYWLVLCIIVTYMDAIGQEADHLASSVIHNYNDSYIPFVLPI